MFLRRTVTAAVQLPAGGGDREGSLPSPGVEKEAGSLHPRSRRDTL